MRFRCRLLEGVNIGQSIPFSCVEAMDAAKVIPVHKPVDASFSKPDACKESREGRLANSICPSGVAMVICSPVASISGTSKCASLASLTAASMSTMQKAEIAISQKAEIAISKKIPMLS